MKKLKTILQILGILIITFVSATCKKGKSTDCNDQTVPICNENPSKTNLRIQNNSEYNFCNVVVNPSSGQNNYGSVKKGARTCYYSFDTVYNYAYIHLYVGEKEFTYQPIDYVGEKSIGI